MSDQKEGSKDTQSKYAIEDTTSFDNPPNALDYTQDGQANATSTTDSQSEKKEACDQEAPVVDAVEKEEKTKEDGPARKGRRSFFAGASSILSSTVEQTHSLGTNLKVAAFGKKLKHQADITAQGNRSIMEIVERHARVDKHAKKRLEKLERLNNSRRWYTIDPDSYGKQTWDLVVLLLVMVNLITIPLSMSQQFEMIEDPAFATLVDVVFIMDLLLTFLTGYDLSNGERIWNQKLIVESYIKSGWFFVDFIACIPWEAFAPADDEDAVEGAKYTLLVRALKLPRLLRLGKVFKYLNRFKYAQVWKIIRLLMIMFIAAHWAGCLFFFLCDVQTQDFDTPWCRSNEYLTDKEGSTRFLVAFHSAFLMLVGEDIGPTTNLEYVYTLLMLVAGQIISAVVIGNISIVLNNQASMSALYTQKMDRVNESMMTHRLPATLQNKVRHFYEYMWNRHRALSHSHTFRHDLNASLRSEVDLFLNREILANNSMFAKVSDSVLIAIVSLLQNQVFLEGDYIIRKGQWGEEMYFILSGKAGAKIKGKIVKSYSPGESFGEVALIEDGGRRKCDVVALSNVDMRIFTRTDFDVLGHRYPELHSRLKAQARAYSSRFKSKSRFKGATTMLAKNGVAGLFSKKVAPDGPMFTQKNVEAKALAKEPSGGGLFGKLSTLGKIGEAEGKEEDEIEDKITPLGALQRNRKKRFTITAEPDAAAIARLNKLVSEPSAESPTGDSLTNSGGRLRDIDEKMLQILEKLGNKVESLESKFEKYQKESNKMLVELQKTIKVLAVRGR